MLASMCSTKRKREPQLRAAHVTQPVIGASVHGLVHCLYMGWPTSLCGTAAGKVCFCSPIKAATK